MPLPFPINWKKPDYTEVFAWRVERLRRLRAAIENEGTAQLTLPMLKIFYRDNPAQFIIDWGMTYDPRLVEIRQSPIIPFLLYPRQEEWIDYALRKWRAREDACTAKSRELGVSWLAMGLSATLSIFNDGMAVGVGSRVEDLVDKRGSPDSLFWKARFFNENVPREFRAGWNQRGDAHMRISYPETGSVIEGEGGDNIGRGGRKGIYFTDEDAYLTNPDSVDSALSFNTNNRHRISSFNGTANPFYIAATEGKVETFIFPWRDDPRKDDEWYAYQVGRLPAHILASEVDMNPAGSIDRIVIPPAWVKSAIDAHRKLGIIPTGQRQGAFDVADEGKDMNAYCGTRGVVVERVEEWTGKGDDIYESVEHCFSLADKDDCDRFDYDADGMGAGVRGDARKINEDRRDRQQPMKIVTPWRASGAVAFPTQEIPSATPRNPLDQSKKRTNEDFFANAGVQAWYHLRVLFQRTHRAVADGAPFDADNIISLSSEMPNLAKLVIELSQPQFAKKTTAAGKMLIDKAPEGMKSPNLADAVKIRFAPKQVSVGFFDLPETAPTTQAPANRPRGRVFR